MTSDTDEFKEELQRLARLAKIRNDDACRRVNRLYGFLAQ